MSSSYSAGSATSSSGGGSGQQLGARPKIARQLLLQQQQQQQQMNKSVNRSRTTNHHHSSSKENKEWNSNWNSILSAQGDLAIKSRNINGQPPSIKSPSSAGRDGMSSSTAAVSFSSDPSLAVIQPVQATTTNGHSQKSPELFHSHHYHARRQRDRQHFPSSSSGAAANNPSRSNSAADLSRQSSTINLSSNASSLNNVNNIKDSNIGGISNIWARWFKRNNNRTSAVTANGRPFSSSYYGAAAGSRSHSVENSPVVSRRRHPMTGSSGQLASDNSDSLSTNSFSFIRVDPALTLRRKYGLMACSNESTDKMGNNHNNNNNIEGDAIRAMRTQWETQMKQMDEFRNHPEDNNKRASTHQFHNNSTTSRKKRPAPQPPASSAASSRQSTNNRASSVTSSGFTHVPGKRKAPSPPSPTTTTTTFNIVVPATILPDLMTTPESASASAGPLTENNKWSNDLNCNLLLDENNKVFRYHQNKFEDCPHNDILKLEGGVLRPLDSSSPSNKSQQQHQEATGSTMDSNHRGMMTLPLKPWYKRGRNNNGNPASGLHHQHSSANAATRSKWKDAALLHHHPAADECSNWAMGLVATHVQHLHPPPELNNTIRSNYSSTVSPGGSTKSEGSVCSSSDGSKSGKQQQQQHRKSLLVNISQLDREATEIIQRERARESQRRRMEDEKFYCGTTTTTTTNHLATVPDVPDESPPRDPPPPPPPAEPLKCARELINMFNSLTDISAGPGPSINSQQTKTAELQLEEKEKVGDANYKTGQTYSSKGTSSQTVPAHPTTTTSNGNCSKLLLLADDQQSTPKTSTVESMNNNTITRLRVNRETVPAGSPTTEQQQQQSIFNPKLDVGSGGGARPKHSPSTSIENKSALVKPTTTTTTNGWACQVCTLVNSDARLWCEACTALKPRQINRTTTTTTTTPVVKETVKIIPKMTEVIPSSPSIHSVTTPNSPEALRQARLAFFLNNGQNNNNNNKTEIENTKRLSQHVGAAVKVSSSCQTQPILATPKLNVISQRPVSIIGNPISDNCPINVNNSHNNNKRVVVPAAVFKDVNPTNFALLSPSRTQLSQYLQQQQASKQQQQQQAGSTESDVQKSDESSDEFNEDKKVELMLLRLEEAIAAGQFDKAAVLAKELAAIKRTPSPAASPPISIKPVEVVPAVPTPLPIVPAVIPKPVAAPRSVVPVVVQEKQSDPVQSSAMNDVPLPAKRLSHLTSPSPLPRKSIRPEEKPEVKLKEEESPIQQLMGKPVEEEIIRPAVLETAIVPVKKLDNTPEVTVRTKRRSVKVSSGQQTTLTFQKKSNPEEMNHHQPRRTQSCIVDDTFNVEFFIEDRSTHSGPFHWPVRPSTTLLELKERTAKSHNIKVECQRWILGRRLADQDQLTLKDYDICPSNSSLFLYVLNDPVIVPKPNKSDHPVDNPTTTTTTTQPTNARRYYNHEEDRYSTCEEDDEDEPLEAAGQHINGPVIINKDPPTLTETDEKQQPETTADQGATGGTDEPLKIDYKKLVDLLDVSDVVTNADSFDCPVCLMTVPAGVGVTLRECLHNFCRDCLAHVIEFSDEATVTCPYRDDNYVCDAILQEIEIKNLVGAKLYEKHLERSMRLAEKTMKNTFHCQTADCPGWAVIEEDNVNVFRCPVCRKNNCLTCRAIHEGANCKEFQDRVNQSADTDEDAKRTKEMIDALVASGEALHCPQCQVVLMKRWGCDWVRCSVCRTEICWVTKQNRWGPKGKGDTSGGCRCGVDGVKCHPLCNYCH